MANQVNVPGQGVTRLVGSKYFTLCRSCSKLMLFFMFSFGNRRVCFRACFNSLNGGTNVPPLSGFVPPLKYVPPPILCGGLSLNLTVFYMFGKISQKIEGGISTGIQYI